MTKITVKELEERGQKAKNALNALKEMHGVTIKVTDDLNVVMEKGGDFVTRENRIIYTVTEAKIVEGTDRMLALTGGVKASYGKTKEGKTVINAYFFDRDRFDEAKAKKWIDANTKLIEKSILAVQESAPAGSFMDVTMRVQCALNDSDLFPKNEYGLCMAYISYVFPGYVVVSYNDLWYRIDYKDTNSTITLSDPARVEMAFVVKESEAQMDRFNRTVRQSMDLEGSANVILKEENESRREAIICLIESGKNFSKKRYYPKSALKEAAPLFAGLKMFLDHATAAEEREKPERSLSDWIATIEESWYDDADGQIKARVKIHNDDFWSKLKTDEVFREHVAVSINASGKWHVREIDGVEMTVIEQIVNPKSVDFVTEPGARGRVLAIIESQNIEKEQDKTMLKTVKLEEVKTERPDLAEALREEGRNSVNIEKIKEDARKEGRLEAEKEHAAVALKEARILKVTETVNGSKLPEAARKRFVESFIRENEAVKDEELDAKLKESIQAEMKHLKDLGVSVKIDVDPDQKKHGSVVESVTSDILKTAGLEEKKKEE